MKISENFEKKQIKSFSLNFDKKLIRHIQKLLGHSSISTTEIYTKVAKSMKKRVLDSYHPLKNKL